jgi:hypothetical protein
MKAPKVIIHPMPADDWILAVRAVKAFLADPDTRETIIVFENRAELYLRRNPASISVWKQPNG